MDPNAQTITIKDVFKNIATNYYAGEIIIKLERVRNPVNNKPANGFVIQTYWDENQINIMDKLNDFKLRPTFDCEYPCSTCDIPNNKRDFCLTCWNSAGNP